jgi:putative flippase GtrA
MPPIGGYVYAGVSALVGLMTPWAAFDVLKEGKPLAAVASLVIGLPFAYLMTKEGVAENRRVNHERARQWAEAPLKAAKHRRRRLLGIGLFTLIGAFDILLLGAPIIHEIATIGGMLVIFSMISVGMSSIRRVDWWSQIKATN